MIRSISLSAIVVLLSGCAGAASRAQPVHETVRVAAPTGERAADRASVQAAFNAVQAGGTVVFAAGAYVIGGAGLVLRTPGVALTGAPDGTTLLGCTREQRMSLAVGEYSEFSEVCGDGFVLAAEAQRVSGLGFESFDLALSIREATEAEEQGRSAAFTGGHVIENNSFHDGNSFDIVLDADSTVRVRRNAFRNVWHAVAIVGGRNIHVTENDVSVPEPERVPHGFAGVAIGALADADGACSSMIVEGNRIDGHTEAVAIAVFPHRLPGSACSDITIRDNEIVMRPVRRPDGRLAIAPAIRLFNAQRLVSEGLIEWGEPPEGGWPDALSEGRISDVRVEGNRITGAVGIGIEAAHVTDSRIVDNEIEVRPAATPEELEGLTVGGNAAPGVWILLGLVDEVNGTPVWVSPGSERTVVRPPAGGRGSTHPATPMADTVNVAPPTGDRETDRASILTALNEVRPGGTIQFAPGTYLIGEYIQVSIPRLTFLGHPTGTTLRGCDPADYEQMEREFAAFIAVGGVSEGANLPDVGRCGILELTSGQQTVRGLTLEHSYWGLILGCCHDGSGYRLTDGGHLIEGNTFRLSMHGIRAGSDWPAPSLIRGNRFIDVHSPIGVLGRTFHLLNNEIAVREPDRVIFGHPGVAIAFGAEPFAANCERNVVAGNRIEGHTDGILLYIRPPGRCRDNIIRDNTIVVRRVWLPASSRGFWVDFSSEDDRSVIGVPLSLQVESGDGGTLAENLIEENHIIGAEGLAIEVLGAARTRIVKNTITGVTVRDPFPGNTLGGGQERWREANGSGIWVSTGSDENEIAGNSFEDVGGPAIFLEGDSNRVELRSADDSVRDLGTGNRVSGPDTTTPSPAYESRFVDIGGVRLHYLDFGGEGLPILFTAGSRSAETWAGFAPRFTDRHRVLAITDRGVPPSEGEESGFARRAGDILALLDTLGIERAVLVANANPAQILIYLAEHHPERLAGLVFLAPASEAGLETVEDPSGAMLMIERGFLSTQGRDPDEAGNWDEEDLYRPRYLAADTATIVVPAVTFVNLEGTRGLERSYYPLEVAELVASGALAIPDSMARTYFERLAADKAMQAEVRTAWDGTFVPVFHANEQAFFRAFGDHLRVVRLDVPPMNGVPVVTGYEYRDAPELIEPHIRAFLEEVDAREQRRPLSPTDR